jgi:hypothetical protein
MPCEAVKVRAIELPCWNVRLRVRDDEAGLSRGCSGRGESLGASFGGRETKMAARVMRYVRVYSISKPRRRHREIS